MEEEPGNSHSEEPRNSVSDESSNSLCEVFKELASESQYTILLMLEEQKEKSAQLAKKLNLTIQETEQNTARLVETGLIKKDSEEFFSLTLYGRILVAQLAPFSFLNTYKDYLNEHFPADLPPKFLKRIGSLRNCELIHENSAIVDKWISIAEEAKEYLRIITSQIPPKFFKQKVATATKGTKIFLIHGNNTIAPIGFKKELTSPSLHSLISQGIYKRKMVEKIQTMVVLNEKRSTLLFPNLKGEPDMHYAFISEDPEFHEWCVDYFDYIWEKAGTYDASKISEVLELK